MDSRDKTRYSVILAIALTAVLFIVLVITLRS